MQIGVAKTDITPTTRGMGMMGWGQIDNVALSVATPLEVRAMVLRQGDEAVALAVADLAFITRSVRDEVLARLAKVLPELRRERVLLMATHTHSGPGGFSEAPFYNATIPGFHPEVLETIVAGIVAAIVQASASARPAQLSYTEGGFAPEVEVAWNRQPGAYSSNPDVTPTEDPRLALDRTMRLLVARDDQGALVGLMSWFAVHGTSIHSDNTALHFDNKGYAAAYVEARHQGAVAGFAQGATGDVTPNFLTHPGLPWVRGKFADDDASARYNGELQGAHAEGLLAAPAVLPLAGPLLAASEEVDFANVEVPADLADGEPRRTGPAEIGMAMFFGTEEGPGLPRVFLPVQGLLMKARRLLGGITASDEVQGEKVTWVESTKGRLLGGSRLSLIPPLPLPAPVARVVEQVRKLEDAAPWTPHVLPVQIVVIGSVAIAAAPGEFTTVSGLRVRRLVAEELAPLGVQQVIFAGYANDYAGYITTPEEYQQQNYEGASTHFGQWTLPAYLSVFRRLARKLVREHGGATRA